METREETKPLLGGELLGSRPLGAPPLMPRPVSFRCSRAHGGREASETSQRDQVCPEGGQPGECQAVSATMGTSPRCWRLLALGWKLGAVRGPCSRRRRSLVPTGSWQRSFCPSLPPVPVPVLGCGRPLTLSWGWRAAALGFSLETGPRALPTPPEAAGGQNPSVFPLLLVQGRV